jgi:hypothetical protein
MNTATRAASIACNKCNAVRSIRIHPCHICQCPEYRLLPLPGQQKLAIGEPGPSAQFALSDKPKRKIRRIGGRR